MNGSLRIGRLQATCYVADERCGPAVRERALRACRDHLPATLRGSAQWFDGEDDSVWIVRRVDLSIVSRTDAAPDEIAQAIVGSLGRALAGTLTGDGDGTNAIRFRNRAAYLSRFIADVATGQAWSRWYFAPMAGWRLLPASAAIRSAVVENPATGLAALRALDAGDLENVLECLTAADEALVLDVLARAAGEGGGPPERPAPAGRDSGPHIQAFRRRPLMAHLGSGDRRRTPKTDLASTEAGADIAATTFGGLVLLLRDVDTLPWQTWTSGWPPVGGVSAGACLKWLTLAACTGNGRSDAFLDDEVWRDLLGIPPTLLRSDVGRWLRGVGQERRRTLAVVAGAGGSTKPELRWLTMPRAVGLSHPWRAAIARVAHLAYRGFSRRLPGFANSTVDYLWRNFLASEAIVEREDGRVVVRYGRPPLHLVLTLTGITRALAAGTDAAGRPIVVFSRE